MARIPKLAAAAVMLALFVAGAADAAEVAGKGHGSLGDKSVLTSLTTTDYEADIAVVFTKADLDDWKRNKGGSWGSGKGKGTTAVFGGFSAEASGVFQFPEEAFYSSLSGKHHGKGRRMLQQATPSDISLLTGIFDIKYFFANVLPLPQTENAAPSLRLKNAVKNSISSFKINGDNGADVTITGDWTNFKATFSGTVGRISESGTTTYASFLPTTPTVKFLSGADCDLDITVVDEDGNIVCSDTFQGSTVSDLSFGSLYETWKTVVGTELIRAKYTCAYTSKPKASSASCFT